MKKLKTLIQKSICTPMFIAALFTIDNGQDIDAVQCPSVDEWLRKLWYICTMGNYLAVQKREILPFVTAWMDLDSITLSDIIQPGKDKYHMISLVPGI